MSHTDGPWTAKLNDNGQEWDIDAATWAVALCMDDPGDGSPEANARLIAAAPDMLAALKAVAADHDASVSDGMGWLVEEPEYIIVRAAIRLAETGERS